MRSKLFLLCAISLSTQFVIASDVIVEEGLKAFEQTLYPMLRTSCTKCHGDGGIAIGHSVSNVKIAYLNSKEFVDFENPTKSIFFRRVKSQHWLKNDPTQTGMTENQILEGMRAWYEAGEKNASASFQLQTTEIQLPNTLPSIEAGKWQTMNWNLEQQDAVYKGCALKIEIQQSSKATPDFVGSYRVRNPMVRCSGSSFRLSGLFVAISNETASFENIYKDAVAQSSVSTDYTSFSNEIMILMQRKRDVADSIKILIKKIEAL